MTFRARNIFSVKWLSNDLIKVLDTLIERHVDLLNFGWNLVNSKFGRKWEERQGYGLVFYDLSGITLIFTRMTLKWPGSGPEHTNGMSSWSVEFLVKYGQLEVLGKSEKWQDYCLLFDDISGQKCFLLNDSQMTCFRSWTHWQHVQLIG